MTVVETYTSLLAAVIISIFVIPAVVGQNCNYNTLNPTNFTITSPLYPANYPSYLDCQWTITAPSPTQVAVVKVLDFSLQGSQPNCLYDYVKFYDGNNTDIRIKTLCGQVPISLIIGSGQIMTVAFHSDWSTTNRGFKIQYNPPVEKTALCGSANLTANSTVQFAISPGYPYNYPSNMDCRWTITADSNSSVIVLNLLDFHLESASPCNDYVIVYDGNSSNPVEEFCGSPADSYIISSGPMMTIDFHSNDRVVNRGFRFEYSSAATSAVCSNSAKTATSSAQYIQSPNYPGDYANNTNCRWVITATNSSQVVVLKLLDFYLEASATSCSAAYDYVAIYDGPTTSSTQLIRLCGLLTTTEFVSTGSTMLVVFHSDDSENYKGFMMKYTSSDKSVVCSNSAKTATSSAQYIQSPNYPGDYANNMDCRWVITATYSSQVVVLKLSDFYLEGTVGSCYSAYDYVAIYDGSTTSSTQLIRLCGLQTTREFVSTGSTMLVVFHSDSSYNYRGFRVEYTSSDKSAVCSNSAKTATSSAQYIQSPNYPSNYPNNMDCRWVITATYSYQVVVLKLLDFHLEGTSTISSSAFDYVAVYDGSTTSSTQIILLSSLQTTTEFVSTDSTMLVVFHSDDSETYRGFRMEYTSSDKSAVCTGGQTLTASSSINYLASPNSPGLYPNNMDCEWHITADFSWYVVVLNLVSFSLESSVSSCSNDYVKIFDGPTRYSGQIAALCGNHYYGIYTSSGSDMTVVFHSDTSFNYAGFKFSYKSQEKSESSSSLSAGAIAGIVIACIAVPCLIVAAIIIFRKYTTQKHIQSNRNRVPIQNGGTTTMPGVAYVTNNQQPVPAPYVMMQNPPQMVPMGTPAYNTNYLPPSYTYTMQPGAAPQGPPPQFNSPMPGPNVGVTSGQGDAGVINKGFSGI